MSILTGAELIDGDAGYFRPDEAIIRGDFIALAVKAYGAEEYYGVDYFNDTTHTPRRGYINAAARLGLVTGYPDGGFHPYSSLTRAEAVTIINGLLHRNSSYGRTINAKTWPDVAEGAWYFEDVKYATAYFEAY